MLLILFSLFIAVVVFQFIYYIIVFGKFSFLKPQNKTLKKIPISIIVCAKNEEENIRSLVPLLVEQEYPQFEIVLIDDASNDGTLEVFEEFEKQHANIKLVKVENNEAFWGNKKYALTLGIKAAKNEYLLFTDADCIPASKNWLATMSAEFTATKTIVLGYGAYEKIKGSLINKIIRFETLLTATQYLSWAKIGKPYMGIGRNMAYKREEFFNVRGFMDHMHVRSGDDDLFIRDAATSDNTNIALNSNSFTISEAPDTLKKWFRQKRRHISTAQYYKFKHQFFLGLFHGSKFIFFILAPLILAFSPSITANSFFISYLLLSYITIGFCAKKFKEKNIIYYLPFLEIFLILFQFAIFITNSISKPRHWK